MSQAASPEDLDLAARVIRGEEPAQKKFIELHDSALRQSLGARCKEAATTPAVDEITVEVLGDCLALPKNPGDPPVSLLVKYLRPRQAKDGKVKETGPLAAWLRRVAIHRLMDWIDAHGLNVEFDEKKRQPGEQDDEEDDETEPEELVRDEDVIELLRSAMAEGFKVAEQEEPLGLISLRVVWMFQAERGQLGIAWNRNQTNVTRWMDKAMELIHKTTMHRVRRSDPLLRIRWRDLLAICARYPEIIAGPE